MKVPAYGDRLNAAAVRLGLAPRHVAAFDSSTAALRALGLFLRGRDFEALGMSRALVPVSALLNRGLPRSGRELVYQWGGWAEAVPARAAGMVRAETVSRWVARHYPERRYPAVAIGSSNGAGVHLCAALGIPWLPQTFLVLVRAGGIHPDDVPSAAAAAREPAEALLEANPELVLHHMRDPNQDRLMTRRALYFRLKRRSLGEVYERFLGRVLPPGGTLLVFQDGLRWLAARQGPWHLFQLGGLGALGPREYLEGGPRVEEFLRRQGSPWRRWRAPAPDVEAPEAEWGYDPALDRDLERLARERGWRLRRLIYPHPEALSPLVAELHRWWYARRGVPGGRLLVESFFLIEPWWAQRTGSVPLWLAFNAEPSAEALERYLDEAGPFEDIRLTLFSHGVESAGLAPAARWERALRRARREGAFAGVRPGRYPRDFEAFTRLSRSLRRVPARFPLPAPLGLDELDRFLAESEGRFEARLEG